MGFRIRIDWLCLFNGAAQALAQRDRTARVVLASDYTGPGSSGVDPTLATVDPAAAGSTDSTDSTDSEPAPSPILTAGANDPECVN